MKSSIFVFYLIKCIYVVEFLLILPVLRPTHGSLPIGPLIDIPKGFSSKMTLKVAPRALEFRMRLMAIFVFISLFRTLLFREKLKKGY